MLSTDVSERQLLDALPVTVYATDLEGNLTSVHRPSSRFGDEPAGTTPIVDELRGKPIWEARADAPPRDEVQRAMHLLRTGRAPIVRWEVPHNASGEARALSIQMTPLHDESHAVIGFAFSLIDVTASHQSREALIGSGIALSRTLELDHAFHEAAQQLRNSIRPDVVVIALADGDSDALHIVYDGGFDGDRRTLEQRFAGAWRSALASGDVIASHSESTLELTAPLRGTSGVLGAISVLVDAIESPEHLADARRYLSTLATDTAVAVERARNVAHIGNQRRLAAIGEVAAGVAHELRNPLFGISSAAQLLRFRAREDPVVEKNVGRILREVERLNRMMTTLLEFGRPVALKLSAGDPDAVWDDVLETERGRLESRVIAVRRSRPSEPTSVPIDAEQLAHVFRNVLSNAVEAAPEASDITLQSTILPNGAWRCRLTNTGSPIPADVLPRVFEIFFSTKPGSTGIGLALCQRIVEDHRGTVDMESSAEAGTTVTITLPTD